MMHTLRKQISLRILEAIPRLVCLLLWGVVLSLSLALITCVFYICQDEQKLFGLIRTIIYTVLVSLTSIGLKDAFSKGK